MLINHFPKSLIRLFSYLKSYKTSLLLVLLSMIGAGASSSLIALLLGKLTDIGFYKQEPWIVIVIAAPVGLIFIAALNGGSMLASNYLLARISQSVMQTLRRGLFARMLRWPAVAYQNNPSGLVASKFINEANFALSSAAKSAIVLVRDSVQAVALTVILVYHNWILALATLCLAPLIAWLLRWILKTVESTLSQIRRRRARGTSGLWPSSP